MILAKLPWEILFEILKKVEDKRDIVQCIYVCKKWEKYFIPRLYSEIDLSSLCLVKLLERTWLYPNGEYVQTIIISPGLRYRTIVMLIHLCPNIKYIKNSYISTKNQFWSIIGRYSHKLTQLEEICPPKIGFVPKYYECVLKFKKTLRNLKVYEFDTSNKHERMVIAQISGFKNLRILELGITHNTRERSFEVFINNCSALETIKIDANREEVFFGSISLDPIVPHTSLRSFELKYSKSFLISDYLSRKFPSLQRLVLTSFPESELWGIPHFFEYLYKIPEFEVYVDIPASYVEIVCKCVCHYQSNIFLDLSFNDFDSNIITKIRLFEDITYIRCKTKTVRNTSMLLDLISQNAQKLCLDLDKTGEFKDNDMEYIFTKLPAISTLEIFNALLLSDLTGSYTALKNLNIIDNRIYSDIFTRCGECFVNLENLFVYTKFDSTFYLNMPTTRFHTLKLTLRTKSKNTSINLHTAVGTNYLNGPGEPLIDIYCHSFDSIVLIVNNRAYNI